MKAMILAAGKGTRVQPLTYELPKPMIPILGKPVLAYLIEHLAHYGVREIMINTSYLHEKIEDYFGDGHRYGVEIGYSFEGRMVNGKVVPHPLGSAGGIRKIQDFGGFFDETTLVLCGDALIDLDLNLALHEHRQRGAIASVITKEVPWDAVGNYGVVVADANGRVQTFQEKPPRAQARSNWASTGIYIFEPEVIDLIPPGENFDIGGDLFPMLVTRDMRFFAQRRHFNWIDIGKISDYWAVLQEVMKGTVAGMQVPGKQVREGVWVGLNTRIDWDAVKIQGPVYIGSGCRIEPGSEIVGPAWIGHGSMLERGSRVVRSMLFEYTHIPAGATFEEVIVCNEYCVDRHGTQTHVADRHPQLVWSDARAAC
jgi:mannose-1-phosphate guanylyltransferase